MFGSHTPGRTAAAVVGVAAVLALAACGDDAPDLDFQSSLEIGVLAPETGALSYLHPAQVAAVELALADINAAGGVWGSPVTTRFADEGTAGDAAAGEQPAVAGAESLIAAEVDAVVGPLATAASLAVIDPFREAGILQVSPGSPGIALDEHPGRELFLRTRGSDALQGRVLAQELVTDQRTRVAVIARDDAYGDRLSALVSEAYQGQIEGEREVVAQVSYPPETTDFAEVVAEVQAAEPDAIVIISFDEAAGIMTGLADAELTPAAGPGWYLVNGGLADYGEALPEGVMAGAKATAPTAGVDLSEFHARLDEHAGALAEHAYAAEAYDSVVLLALGAVQANTDDPAAIRSAMIEISRDPGGQCGTFADCLELIRDGEDVNYSGPTGPVEWTDAGDPRQGAIGVYAYAEDNTFTLARIDIGQL